MKKHEKRFWYLVRCFILLVFFSVFPLQDALAFTNDNWLWPVPPQYRHLSRGYYVGSTSETSHLAIDLSVGVGTDVYASKAGTVMRVYSGCKGTTGRGVCNYTTCNPNFGMFDGKNCNFGFGIGLVIRHTDNSVSAYAHLSSVLVKEGASVKQGQLIGKSGNTGDSSGPHLHFIIGSKAKTYDNRDGYIPIEQVNNNPYSASYQITSGNKTNLSQSNGYVYNTNGIKYIFSVGSKLNLVSDNGIITQGTSGIYEKGKVIDLSVTPNYGYIFSKWTSSNGGTFSDATSPTCTFTMPDKATTVTAEFIENPLIPKVSWNVASATNITQNNAQLNGVLRVLRSGFALSDFALPTVSELYCFASRSQAEVKSATASSHGAAYYVKYANPSYESDSDGRTYVRSIMTLSSMKNDAGAALNLQPGETCYFKWVAVVSNAPTSSAVNSFKLPAAPASWYQLESNTSQGMFSGRMRYSASQRMVEAGCFVSPDKTLVMNATHTNKNGTALKVDKAASGFEYGTIDNDRFTMVYYKAPPFDTIKTFAPGVTYYYKFYGITSSGDVAYSSISSYTPPATTTYALSVVAGIGGQIVAGNSGNYAAGNILSLIATPDEGYVFKGWVATSGTLSNAASSSSSFTVPASVSTVTAKFEPIEYTVNVLASGAGTVDTGSSGNYTVGSTVPLKATPDAGFRFVRWSSNAGGVFADAQSAVTTFTTPASNATIVAEFEEDVSSITFPQASYQIELGDTLALTAEILPEHRKDAALTWTSSDPTIASVDANGVVTMLTSGQAIIRAAAPNGVYGEVTIQSNIHIESVHVVVAERTGAIAEALVMRVGDTASFQTFTAPSTLPSGLTFVTTVNDDLMKVDMAAGTVTALKPGIAYLSHTIYDSVNGQQHQLASGDSCMILIIDSTREFILPDTLTAIRSEAFANTNGTFIQIPDSVTDIGSKAFTAKDDLFILMDCSVKRIIAEDAFPENLTYIIDTSGIYHVDAALEFDLNNWHYHFDGYLE